MNTMTTTGRIRIELTTKQVYGATKLYPANDQARDLARLAGTTTLTMETLNIARRMGMEVVIDAERTVADHLRGI